MQATRYSSIAMAFHWLTVILLAVVITIGTQLENPPEGWGDALYRLHWSFGLTLLATVVLRLINRWAYGAPAPYAGLPDWERKLSVGTQHTLYALLIIVPLLGWLGKSAYGGAITVFGLFDMPALLAQNTALGERILGAHKLAVALLVLTAGLHIAGALYHLVIKRDGVIARMWPWARSS